MPSVPPSGAPPHPMGQDATPSVVSRSWMVAFVLAMLGVSAAWFGPLQVLLPAQSERLAGGPVGAKENLLTLVTAIGALASIVATPLWGLLADRRARSGHPSRREIIAGGTMVGVVGLAVLAAADSPATMAWGWAVAQAGLGGPLAALGALIADQVPARQRGLVSSLFGVAQVAGVVLGTVLATIADAGPAGYVALAAALPLLCAALWFAQRGAHQLQAVSEREGGHGRLRFGAPFAWMWMVRFLLNVANALIVVYLYFYVADGLHIADVATWVLVATLLNVLLTVGVGAVAGIASDRSGHRLPFALAGGAITGLAAVVLAFSPNLPVALLGAAVFGVGWGLYIAVDMALFASVLPPDSASGALLGIANIGQTLPQVVAPLLAAPLVTLWGGFTSLYLCSALFAAAGLACLIPVRRHV